ncbi:lactate utilization protein [Alkaliphilus sp. B6464]|uniref:lactate utilization protein n=1 Tax=Alkaliphilus sp. B6464 TaxID=2731219 RepID=UPI001BAC85C4|nr:lactate utilization protein [Alkaliphilus sp. B6464]QUH20175.1 lactate utilization protein [Alkaliphilus sp. B6464]
MEREKIEYLIKGLAVRNIDGYFFETFEEAKSKAIEMIPADASIGIGNSITLKNMRISKELGDRGNIVYDKTIAKSKEESKELKRKSLLTDWYITGTNAISLEGHLVNMDHSGNRVAAMLYGPDNVIVIIGINKITNTLDEAIYRVRNIASPQNARRAGFNPPCVDLGRCIDCRSTERVCNNLVVIEGQNNNGRIKVFIVNENDGF